MSYDAILREHGKTVAYKIGDKVIAWTGPNDAEYGIIRAITDHRGYAVYWPSTGNIGDGWCDWSLEPSLRSWKARAKKHLVAGL